MAQAVPEFRFSDDALKVRQFLYEYWCARGHGPNLRAVHEATGFARERILALYRELDLGLICTVDHDSQNGNLLKLQPFSSYPSQVEVWLDGRFHCWAGCAMESVAISRMPPFAGKELRLESYCACCLVPISLRAKDSQVSGASASVLIHVSTSPRDWNKTNIVAMCDSMNYVLDADHALAFERSVSRRGVLLTIEQAQRFVADTGNHRMWHYDWPPARVVPERIIAGIKALGVDVTNWGG
jgi:hypothetical protein